ncbi:MAG: hypothetical protein V4497_10830 [Bacteroidota bacterium]
MKKIALFLVLMTTLLSCSIDKPDSYTYYVLPIESYTMPTTFTVGATHEIKLKFQKPTACYLYGGIYYYSLDNTRTIGINASVKDGESCSEALPAVTEVSFNFVPATAGTYIFKFYKGKDDGGTDVFEDVEITVTQ